MKNKKFLSIFLVLIIFATLSSFVSAEFGVGSTGGENLYPGESRDSAFSVQNTLDDAEDLVVEASILEGIGYITFLGDVSRIEVSKGKVVSVPFKMSIPETATVGDKYKVSVLFKTISGGTGTEGGMIEFSFNVEKFFDINVVGKPAPEEQPAPAEGVSMTWIILGIVAVVVLMVIIYFAVKSKRESAVTAGTIAKPGKPAAK